MCRLMGNVLINNDSRIILMLRYVCFGGLFVEFKGIGPVAIIRFEYGLIEKALDVFKQQKGEDQHRRFEVVLSHRFDLVWRQIGIVLVFDVINDEDDADGKDHDGKEYIQKDKHGFHFQRMFCFAGQR